MQPRFQHSIAGRQRESVRGTPVASLSCSAAAAEANSCNVPRAKAARVPEFDDDCRWVDPAVLTGMGLTSLKASRTL